MDNEKFGKIKEALKRFSISSFRGKQYECIDSILKGKDVFVLWPTGAGFSFELML
jgi:superfamily II DNA helicase RecQ